MWKEPCWEKKPTPYNFLRYVFHTTAFFIRSTLPSLPDSDLNARYFLFVSNSDEFPARDSFSTRRSKSLEIRSRDRGVRGKTDRSDPHRKLLQKCQASQQQTAAILLSSEVVNEETSSTSTAIAAAADSGILVGTLSYSISASTSSSLFHPEHHHRRNLFEVEGNNSCLGDEYVCEYTFGTVESYSCAGNSACKEAGFKFTTTSSNTNIKDHSCQGFKSCHMAGEDGSGEHM